MAAKISFPVRYFEIDSLGIVHHSNYPNWFETGRNDFLKNAGIPNYKIKALGLFLPLSGMNCEFKRPAKLGDEIVVITSLVYLSCVKLKFEYKLFNKIDGKLLAKGRTIHAWTDKSIHPINIEKTAPEVYKLLQQTVEVPVSNKNMEDKK